MCLNNKLGELNKKLGELNIYDLTLLHNNLMMSYEGIKNERYDYHTKTLLLSGKQVKMNLKRHIDLYRVYGSDAIRSGVIIMYMLTTQESCRFAINKILLSLLENEDDGDFSFNEWITGWEHYIRGIEFDSGYRLTNENNIEEFLDYVCNS